MTSTPFRASLALAVTLLTLACGGSDGGPGTTFPDSVSAADAADHANATAGYAEFVSRSMNFGGPSIIAAGPAMTSRLGARLRAGPVSFPGWTPPTPDLSLLDWRDRAPRVEGIQRAEGEGCTTTIRGSMDPWGLVPVDANGNGLPDDFYLKYVCVEIDSLGGGVVDTHTNTEEIHYQEVQGSLYGLTVSLFEEGRVADNRGRYFLARYDIHGTLDIRHDGLTDRSDYIIRTESDTGTGPRFTEDAEAWSNAFTPSGSISGTLHQLPAGTLTLGGHRYHTDSERHDIYFTVATPVPLWYSSPCAAADSMPPFTAGALRGELNGRSTQGFFEVGFPACGQYVVSVDTTFDGVAPH